MLNIKKTHSLIIAIMALSMIELSWINVSPGLAVLLDVYSAEGYGVTDIQMVQATPSLFMLASVMASPWLCKRIGAKTVALSGVAMAGLGGTLPGFVYGYPFLIAMSAIKGLGLGLLYSLASGGLIVRNFQGDLKDRLLGYQMTVKNLGGMLMTITAGYLATSMWNRLFLVNLIAVPVFIAVAICMPPEKDLCADEPKAEEGGNDDADDKEEEKVRITLPVFRNGLIIFFWMLIYNVMTPNFAMLITGQGLGDSIEAGYGTSIYTLAGLLFGFVFLYFVKIFGNLLIGVGMVLTAAVVIGLTFADTLSIIYMFIFVGGCGLAAVSGAAVRETTALAEGINKIMAVSVISASINLAMFLSPIVINFLTMTFLGDGANNRFEMAAMILTPYAIGILIWQIVRKRKGKEERVMPLLSEIKK